ncbi:hypothetical protein DL98DRAFT_587049 [Cadophora sp. DSE1049]|nr:hypothetical protein DL98DRAFT_587049 [Cadophora sp. DSE1049]
MLLQEEARQSTETSILNLSPLDYAAMFGHVECLQRLLNFRPPMPMMRDTDCRTTLDSQDKALHIAASCGWLNCVKILCELGADPFKSKSTYLKLDESKTWAVVVEEEGDAQLPAVRGGHYMIVTYFDNSETCREHRLRKYASEDPSERPTSTIDPSHTPYTPHTPKPEAESRTDIHATDNQDPTYPPPQPSKPSYKVFRGLLSAPLADNFSRLGSHSATVPAYSSPAFQSLGSEPTPPSNSYQSSTPYARLPYGQPSSLNDPKQSSLSYSYSNPYGTPQAGSLQSYPTSRLTPALQYPPLGVSGPQTPWRFFNGQRHPQGIGEVTSVRANLVRMLGAIGNPGMLADDEYPTNPEMLIYDNHKHDYVVQMREAGGAGFVTMYGVPVFEMSGI